MNSSVVTYFEDFTVGDIYEHSRGRTVTNFDNYSITHMSMNTAEAHFNLPYSLKMLDGRFRERIVAGPCTIAIVVGLTSQDMSENAFVDDGLTGIKLHHPVFAGLAFVRSASWWGCRTSVGRRPSLQAGEDVVEDAHSVTTILRDTF